MFPFLRKYHKQNCLLRRHLHWEIPFSVPKGLFIKLFIGGRIYPIQAPVLLPTLEKLQSLPYHTHHLPPNLLASRTGRSRTARMGLFITAVHSETKSFEVHDTS